MGVTIDIIRVDENGVPIDMYGLEIFFTERYVESDPSISRAIGEVSPPNFVLPSKTDLDRNQAEIWILTPEVVKQTLFSLYAEDGLGEEYALLGAYGVLSDEAYVEFAKPGRIFLRVE